MAAKRARRKKRDKEKGKKKTEGAEGAEVEDAPVAWEERVVEWCVIRANAKVRSFAISSEDTGTTKSGISVSPSL